MEKTRQKWISSFMFVVITAVIPIVGSHAAAEHNYYISVIAAGIIFLPFLFIILRLCDICGGVGNVFEYFGSKSLFFGKLITGIYTVYALITAFTTLRVMGEEVKMFTLFNTPMIFLFAFALILYVYSVNKGYRVFGHFSALYIPVLIVGVVAYIMLSIERYEWGNIEPVFASDIPNIALSSGGNIGCFWGDTVLLLFIAGMRKPEEKKEPLRKRYFLLSYAVAFTVILFTVMNTLLVLGGEAATKLYFPHYISASLISLGFVTRLEIVLNVLYFIEMNIKVILCLYCACWGVNYILSGRKTLPVPMKRGVNITLCSVTCICAAYIFSTAREFFVYFGYYSHFATVFLVLCIILWVSAEIIERRGSIKNISSGKLQKKR